MPLNRAAFNALVDDDGSDLVGTPWEKARIAGVILDPVDAELARVDGAWITSFVPGLYATGGTWSSPSPYFRYRVKGPEMGIDFSIEGGTLSAAVTDVSIQLPAFAAIWAGTPTFAVAYFHALGADPVMATIPASRNVITLYRFGSGLTFAAGPITIRGHIAIAT